MFWDVKEVVVLRRFDGVEEVWSFWLLFLVYNGWKSRCGVLHNGGFCTWGVEVFDGGWL